MKYDGKDSANSSCDEFLEIPINISSRIRGLIGLLGGEPVLGLELAQAVADVLSFVISLPIGIMVLREMKQMQKTLALEV